MSKATDRASLAKGEALLDRLRSHTTHTQTTLSHTTLTHHSLTQIANFTRLLLKNGEHTWGKDVKSYLGKDKVVLAPYSIIPSAKTRWS